MRKLQVSLLRRVLAMFGLCIGVVAFSFPAGAAYSTPTIVSSTVVPEYLNDVAVDASHVWVAGTNSVFEYNLSGVLLHTFTIPVSVNAMVMALVSDGTKVYVAARDQYPAPNQVYRIDIATATLDGTSVNLNCGGGENPTQIISDGTSLWVSDMNTNSISRIDPTAWTTATCYTGFDQPKGLYSDGTTVWVADNGLKQMPISSGTVTNIGSGKAYDSLTSSVVGGNGGQLWVNGWSTAYHVDPSSGAVLAQVDGLNNISWLILQGSTLWAAQRNSFTISQIDASTATLLTAADTSVLGYGSAPVRIAAGATNIWAAINTGADSNATQIAPGAEVTTTTSTTTTTTTTGPTTTAPATTTTKTAGGLATTGSELRGLFGLCALLFAAGAIVLPARRKRAL